jgi:hypothetical protein
MHAQGRFFVDVDVISDSFLLSLLSMIPRAYIPRSVLVCLSTFLEEAIFSREREREPGVCCFCIWAAMSVLYIYSKSSMTMYQVKKSRPRLIGMKDSCPLHSRNAFERKLTYMPSVIKPWPLTGSSFHVR